MANPREREVKQALAGFQERAGAAATWAECPKSRNRRHWYVGYPRHRRRCRWCGKLERGPF